MPVTARPFPGAIDESEAFHGLSQLRVQRHADGRLTIEAPSEAADGLAALLEGMGRLLREARRARTEEDGEAL